MWLNALRRWADGTKQQRAVKRGRRGKASRFRPGVEVLEDRLAPALTPVDNWQSFQVPEGQTLSLDATSAFAGTPLTYSWTINGVTDQADTGSTPNLTWDQLQQTFGITDAETSANGVSISISVTASDGTDQATANTTLAINAATLMLTFPSPLPALVVGQQFTDPVAYLTDSNTFATASDFFAPSGQYNTLPGLPPGQSGNPITIDWGDNSATSGFAVADPTTPGGFFVYEQEGGLGGGPHTYQSAGTYTVTVTVPDVDGTSATATASQPVNPLTSGNVQTEITTASQSTSSGTPVIALQAANDSDLSAVVAGLNALQNQTAPAANVTVQLALTGSSYTGETVGLPSWITLYVNGSQQQSGTTIDPDSPALTVTSGNVVWSNTTFVTTGDAPTILVTGGSLTLRNDIIAGTTQYGQPAIEVNGGMLDMGTDPSSDPGGNTISLSSPNGSYQLGDPAIFILNIDGLATSPTDSNGNLELLNIGNTYTVDGVPASLPGEPGGTAGGPYSVFTGQALALQGSGTWLIGNSFLTGVNPVIPYKQLPQLGVSSHGAVLLLPTDMNALTDSSQIAFTTLTITEAPISLTVQNGYGIAGTSSQFNVASLLDMDPNATPGDYVPGDNGFRIIGQHLGGPAASTSVLIDWDTTQDSITHPPHNALDYVNSNVLIGPPLWYSESQISIGQAIPTGTDANGNPTFEIVGSHTYAAPGIYNIYVSVGDYELGQPVSVTGTITVTDNFQDILTASLGSVGNGNSVSVTVPPGQDTNGTTYAQELINAVDALSPPSQPSTINVNLNGGTTTNATLNPPAGMTVNFFNGTFTTDPPALTVSSGNVTVADSTFTNAADAPSMVVNGGSLTLLNDTIDETVPSGQPAIVVNGGSLDLGSGNSLIVREGSPVTFVGLTLESAAAGTISAGPTPGSFVYTPPDLVATDSLTVEFTLPDGSTSTATLAVSVNPATPVVSVTDASGSYNGNPFAATAQETGATGQPVNGDLALTYYSGIGISGIGTSTAPTTAGTYTVVATFASSDPDYTDGSASTTFTIAPATPTLSLAASSGSYNGQPFAASATVVGVVPGVDNSPATALEGVPVTLTYYAGSTASGPSLNGPPIGKGTYTVVAAFAGSTDYSAVSKSETFTIAQAPLTVTVNSVSAVYGQPIPTLTGRISGIQNGDPIAATYSTSAAPTSPVGSYPIVVTLSDGGTGKLADYAVTVIPGTVTIAQPAPGVSLVGSTLYIYGAMNGHGGDSIQISQAGSGVQVNASINGVHTTQTYNQPIAAIYVFGFNNTQTIQMASGLTIPSYISEGNANGDSIHLGNGDNVVVIGNGNGDRLEGGNGNNVVTLGNGNGGSVQLGNGNNTVTVGNGNGDRIGVGDGNNILTAGNGNGDSLTAGNGDNLLIAGLGQHSVQAGNGSNILIDGSVTPQGSATLGQVLDEWILDGASAASLIRSQLSVIDNTSRPNTLSAGRGLDWFWATYGKDSINRKAGDLLN